MSKEQLKQYYHRFRHWQQASPHYANRHEGLVRQCHNCGNEFVGNFCPICGQRAELGRVGWNSIRENVTLLWGLDSRSFTYTLIQLLGRPGYLVRDYISGHRQVSFPPVKLLVILCLFVTVFEQVFQLENKVLEFNFNVPEVDSVIAWINDKKCWATLLVQSLYILPTWLVFRFAPAYPRHSLPEGFFLQVFLSVQGLLLSSFGYWDRIAEIVVVMVYMYITYCQLFGYGWWSTLWRFAVVVLLQLAMMLTVIVFVIFFFVFDMVEEADTDLYKAFVFVLAVTIVVVTIMLYVTNRINKRKALSTSKQK